MAVSVVSSKILHNSFTKYTPNKRAFNASKQGQAGLYLEDQHMVSHRLRDTFEVSMLEKGVPMEEVARMRNPLPALGTDSIHRLEFGGAFLNHG